MTHLEQKMEDQIKDLNTKLEEVIIKLDQYKNILGKISGNKECHVNLEIEEQRKNLQTKNVKEISKKFASISSFHGLTRVIKAENPAMKLIWALMTLISLSVGIWIMTKTVQDYFKYDVFTQLTRIHSKSSLLPSVAFCLTLNKSISIPISFYFTQDNKSRIEGEMFKQQLPDDYYSCIKYNHYRLGDNEIEPFYGTFESGLYFYISGEVDNMRVFVFDNYLNVLDYSHLATVIEGNSKLYFIDLTKRVETMLEEPYNDCQSMSDTTYRQVNCKAQCRNEKLVKGYNCTRSDFYSVSGYRICNKTRSSYEFDALCDEQCPQECAQNKYESVVTKGDANVTKVVLQYTDTSYLKRSETPKLTVFTLVSNIGGTMGLFIGIRFLSLVEILEYFTEITLIFYKEKRSD